VNEDVMCMRPSAQRALPAASAVIECTSVHVAGAQALEARSIYAAMKDGLCRPDALTLTSLATAYQRGGQWDWAEQVCLHLI
jgi:hypothetical protein